MINENDMIIKASNENTGVCAYCKKEGVSNISLTFMAFICDIDCDNEYFREYVNSSNI